MQSNFYNVFPKEKILLGMIHLAGNSPEEKVERLYIMYVLGNGLSENDHSVGPLSEIVLHVIGNVTGYS